MHNFWRAIQITLKYKWNIVGVIVSSLLLAICWGGNIATVYPLVQASFQGDSITTWYAKEIDAREERLEKLRGELELLHETIDRLENSRDADVKSLTNTRRSASVLERQILTTEKGLKSFRAAEPYVERWTPSDPFMTVVMLMVFVLVTTLIKSVCTYTHSYLSSRISQLGSLELRSLFFRRMLGYEVNFFSQKGISDATTRFTSDMGTLSNGLTIIYGKALREPLKMIVCLVGAAIVSWQLLLFTFLFVPIAALLIRWLAKSLKRVVRRAMMEMAALYSRIEETFRAIRVVKSFNREDYEVQKFQRSNQTYFQRGMKTAKYDALTSPSTEVLGIGMLVLAIIAGAYLIIYQKTSLFGIPTSSRPLDLGSLVLFYGFLIGASDPARRLTDVFTNIQSACAAADRVYEVIDRKPLIVDCDNPKPFKQFTRELVFQDVSYIYPREELATPQPQGKKRVRFEDVAKEKASKAFAAIKARFSGRKSAINDATTDTNAQNITDEKELDAPKCAVEHASLTIKCGETIAIVGRSGCGKSTLLSMIPRFIDPTSGHLILDGVLATEMRLDDLRALIGLVSQDSVLFNDTVFENIRYGRLDATEEEVMQAAKDAYADEFIRNELPNGYATIVGPGGGALSGGQRQRIALARALLKNPKIFLLDEATSQIDIQSERYIHQALKKFVGNRTTILVTHRLGAIELADRVVVMSEGKIQFIGSHEEALKNSPFYANLWASEALGDD